MSLDVIESIKATMAKGGIAQAQGLVNYSLLPAARLLYPVITPLRNMIARTPHRDGDVATRWKGILNINSGKAGAGTPEGVRGSLLTTSVIDYVASFKTLSLDNYVTFQADWAAQGFDDAKATAVNNTLRALMIEEEAVLFGGNASLALGQTGTPVLANSASGGAIADGATVVVFCVALTLEGYNRVNTAVGIAQTVTETASDGTTFTHGGGSAIKSASASTTVGSTGSNANSVAAYVAPVNGAVAYAWYAGATEAASAFYGTSTINSIIITTAAGTGTQNFAALDSSDHSTNALVFDGLLSFIFGVGPQTSPVVLKSGAYVKTLATGTAGVGTPLTSDGAAGIVEINDALKYFWNTIRMSPTHIFVAAQEAENINAKVVAAGGAPIFRFLMDKGAGDGNTALQAGSMVGSYLNKYTNTLLKLVVHPNAVAGTIVFYSAEVPYSYTNTPTPIDVAVRQDYRQIQYPITKPRYEYQVLSDEVLRVFYPQAFGAICNIANG